MRYVKSEDVSDAEFPRQIKVNFFDSLNIIRAVLPVPISDYAPMTSYFKGRIDPNTFGDLKEVAHKVLGVVDVANRAG